MAKSSRRPIRSRIVDKPQSNGLFWLRGFELLCVTDFNLLANRSINRTHFQRMEFIRLNNCACDILEALLTIALITVSIFNNL